MDKSILLNPAPFCFYVNLLSVLITVLSNACLCKVGWGHNLLGLHLHKLAELVWCFVFKRTERKRHWYQKHYSQFPACVYWGQSEWFIPLYTRTGHLLRYAFLVPVWTPNWVLNCPNFSQHSFSKVLERILKDFCPYWRDIITQTIQICRLHIYDANLWFHYM